MRPIRAAALLLLASPCRAFAQDPPKPEVVVGEPVEVVIHASPKRLDVEDSSRSALWMDAESLRSQAPRSVAEALRFQGGVAVQQTTPGQSTVYVRGLSGREVLHLVDGVRVNSTIFRAGNNPYLSLIDPYSLTLLEVVRGPSSVLHGSDALGGVIIGTTRLPGYRLGEGHTRASVHSSITSNPVGTAARIATEHSARRWAAHLGLTYYGAADIRPGGGQLSPEPSSWAGLSRSPHGAYQPRMSVYERGTAFSTYAGDGALRLKLARGVDLALRAQAAYRPELVRYDEITPRFKREYPASAESSLSPLARWASSATLSHRSPSAPYEELLIALSFQRTEEHARRRSWDESCLGNAGETPCSTALTLSPSTRLRREDNRSDALGLRMESRWKSERAGRGAILGAEIHHDRVASRASSLRTDQAGITEEPARYPDGSSQTQAGVFGQLEAEIGAHLRVHGGARGALFALDIRERAGNEATPSFSSTLFDGTFSLGARWEFAPGLAWVANAGRGVRAPNVQDFASLGPRAGNRVQLPNADIRPESSLGTDTGFRARAGRLRADVSLFALRYQDAIVLVPTTVDGATEDAEGLGYVKSANASRVDLYGAEGALEVPFFFWLGGYVRWLAMQGTQFNDPGTGLPASTPADRAPPVTTTFGVWLAPRSEVSVDLFAHARARQARLNDPTNLDDNRIPDGGTPGYATLHFAARAALSPQISARFGLDNLTNELVLDHGSGFYRPGFGASAAVSIRTE